MWVPFRWASEAPSRLAIFPCPVLYVCTAVCPRRQYRTASVRPNCTASLVSLNTPLSIRIWTSAANSGVTCIVLFRRLCWMASRSPNCTASVTLSNSPAVTDCWMTDSSSGSRRALKFRPLAMQVTVNVIPRYTDLSIAMRMLGQQISVGVSEMVKIRASTLVAGFSGASPMRSLGASALVLKGSGRMSWSKKSLIIANAPYTIEKPTIGQAETRIHFAGIAAGAGHPRPRPRNRPSRSRGPHLPEHEGLPRRSRHPQGELPVPQDRLPHRQPAPGHGPARPRRRPGRRTGTRRDGPLLRR